MSKDPADSAYCVRALQIQRLEGGRSVLHDMTTSEHHAFPACRRGLGRWFLVLFPEIHFPEDAPAENTLASDSAFLASRMPDAMSSSKSRCGTEEADAAS